MFASGPGDLGSIPGRVIPKTLKMALPCLTLSNIKYVSRIKWSNPRKGVAPSPTPWCCSYWKGSLLVALDNGCQLTIYIYIYIYISWIDFEAEDLGNIKFFFYLTLQEGSLALAENQSTVFSVRCRIHIYIYIYCHPQTNYFVVSQPCRAATHGIETWMTIRQSGIYIYIYI